MRKLLLFVVVMLLGSGAWGQIVPSSCTAPDSIVKKYKEDGDRLAERKFFRRNYTEKDSVLIPKVHSDTVLNALLAVYNATSIPARDTVVGMYDVHTLLTPTLHYLFLKTPNNVSWMWQLNSHIIPTGTASVDSLLLPYSFQVTSFMNVGSNLEVYLKADSICNTTAIGNLFMNIQSVISAHDLSAYFDWHNITDSITSNYVELIYSVGWEDCPAGCTFRRYFKFHVYYDCSVSFEGSWGNTLSSIQESTTFSITITPNPTSGQVTIKGITQPTVAIYNLMGQKVGTSQGSNEVSLAHLPAGMYLVQVFNKDMELVKSEKVVKE